MLYTLLIYYADIEVEIQNHLVIYHQGTTLILGDFLNAGKSHFKYRILNSSDSHIWAAKFPKLAHWSDSAAHSLEGEEDDERGHAGASGERQHGHVVLVPEAQTWGVGARVEVWRHVPRGVHPALLAAVDWVGPVTTNIELLWKNEKTFAICGEMQNEKFVGENEIISRSSLQPFPEVKEGLSVDHRTASQESQ